MGTQVTITRRGMLTAAGLGGLALAIPEPLLAAAPAAPRVSDLQVSPTRATKLVAWAPTRPKGVVLFSTGHGSWPERYDALAGLLVADGFAVLSPVHVDSLHYPERAKFTLEQSFPERLADMAATAAHAAKVYPGLPVIAAGHSFGTLIALCGGGALAGMGPFRVPAVKAVLGFSSPGRIPGLIGPDAYTSVQVPVMMVTGSADLVPGFVADPADHLFPVETAPTPAFALVVYKGAHELVADGAMLARVAPAVQLFVDGYGLNDGRARHRLPGWRAAEGDVWTAYPRATPA